MNPDDLIALNEEIAGMARAGLPLDQGLAALAQDLSHGRLQRVTATLAHDLHEGQTLPQALARQGNNVPPYYASLVSAGIRTGRIGEVLVTMTAYARTVVDLRSIIVASLFYPMVVLIFAMGVVGFMLLFVLPQFEVIFKDFGMRVPWITECLLMLGRNPLPTLLVPTGLIVGVILFRFVLSLTPGGRSAWARLVYAIPIVGTLLHSARLAAFTDLLGILIDNELPLPEAFRLAGLACSDPITAQRAHLIFEELSQGDPLGKVLKHHGLVPEWVCWMTGLGERRGNLGQTLHQIAQTYRQQVEMRAILLRSILPPLMIILVAGVFVALFVIALMMPLFSLLEGLTGGK